MITQHTTTILQPFVWDYSQVSWYQKKCHLLGFMVQEKITKADALTIWQMPHHLDHRCPTSIIPTIFMPDTLPVATLHSQFILARDRHQVCWVAYPVACSDKQCVKNRFTKRALSDYGLNVLTSYYASHYRVHTFGRIRERCQQASNKNGVVRPLVPFSDKHSKPIFSTMLLQPNFKKLFN